LEILEQKENETLVSFYCKQGKIVDFCHLPKINSQGTFIINGHEKVVVLQSVRAPTIYHFAAENGNSFYSEIIPFKGP